MPAYREDRRVEGVRRLGAVSRDEAMEDSDRRRQERYEREREAIADERRKQGRTARPFADLVKKP